MSASAQTAVTAKPTPAFASATQATQTTTATRRTPSRFNQRGCSGSRLAVCVLCVQLIAAKKRKGRAGENNTREQVAYPRVQGRGWRLMKVEPEAAVAKTATDTH